MRIIFLILFSIIFLHSKELESITLQLQWKHQYEFAGFYAAKELGFYDEVGLDVEFIEYDGKSNIADDIIQNNADFGLTYASIIAEYLEHKPVVLVANYFKQSPLVLVAQKEIKTPKDLIGKKIMGVSNSIDGITLQLMLEKFDVSLNDVKTVATTFDINDFIEKKVDAMAVFTTNEIYKLDKQNSSYNLFNPSVYGMEYYDVNLFTSQDFALKNPQIVKKFHQASNKGWKYALENQEEIVELILRKYNTQNKTRDELLFEAKQIKHLMLSSSEEIGSIELRRVELIAKNFIEAGYIKKTTDLNLNKFIFGFEDIKNRSFLIQLTPQEKNYLDRKDYISMCVDPDWKPYEIIDEKQQHLGLAADFIKSIERKIGKDIRLIPTSTWAESISFAKEKKCEILSFLNETEDRQKFLNFTSPLYEETEVIITRTDVGYINGLKGLKDKSVAIVKGYKIDEILTRDYKDIKRIYVKNYEEGLQKVANNEVFASINSLFGTAHLVKELGLLNVKIAGETKFYNTYKLGVIKDDVLLHSILSKAVDNISQKEKDEILSNWVRVKFDKGIDYTFVWQITFGFLIILLLVFYRHYTIKRINQKLQKEMNEKLQEIIDKDRMIFHQSKLIAMGEMIENIAHQWRQPLAQINSCVLNLDAYLDRNNLLQDELVKNKFDEIESLTHYMSKTIDDFKNFFNPDKKIEIFLLNQSVHNALKIVDGALKANYIDTQINVEEELKLNSFMQELEHVFIIILNNAKDALVANKKINDRKITITTKNDDNYIKLYFCDNAGGIRYEHMEKIFEPYFTTKHKTQGTGLGLYMAKMIIEEGLKGKMLAYNVDGGACFELNLPKGKE